MKEKLIELLKEAPFEGQVLDYWWFEEKIARIADHLIANGVTVQKKGEWIETEEGTICSDCHKHPFEDGYYAIANYNGDFCPNCGADMRPNAPKVQNDTLGDTLDDILEGR